MFINQNLAVEYPHPNIEINWPLISNQPLMSDEARDWYLGYPVVNIIPSDYSWPDQISDLVKIELKSNTQNSIVIWDKSLIRSGIIPINPIQIKSVQPEKDNWSILNLKLLITWSWLGNSSCSFEFNLDLTTLNNSLTGNNLTWLVTHQTPAQSVSDCAPPQIIDGFVDRNPSPIGLNIGISDINDNSITLNRRSGCDDINPINLSWQIEGQGTGRQISWDWLNNGPYKIKELNGATNYELKVFSDRCQWRYVVMTALPEPRPLSLDPSVSYDQIEIPVSNCPQGELKVTYQAKPGGEKTEMIIPSSDLVKINNLSPGTEYQVEIECLASGGRGLVELNTLVCEELQSVEADYNTNNGQVTITVPEENNAGVEYQVEWQEWVKSGARIIEQTLPTLTKSWLGALVTFSASELALAGLTVGNSYLLSVTRICSRNNLDCLVSSNPIKLELELTPCQTVTDVCFVTEESGLKINWQSNNTEADQKIWFRKALSNGNYSSEWAILNPDSEDCLFPAEQESFLVQPLEHNQSYQFRIETLCNLAPVSTGWYTFNFQDSCPNISNLQISFNASSDLLAVWDVIDKANYYKIEWQPINQTEPLQVWWLDSNRLNIKGLTSDTDYRLAITTYCLAGSHSQTITENITSPICPAIENWQLLELGPSKAVWQVVVEPLITQVWLEIRSWSDTTTNPIDYSRENWPPDTVQVGSWWLADSWHRDNNQENVITLNTDQLQAGQRYELRFATQCGYLFSPVSPNLCVDETQCNLVTTTDCLPPDSLDLQPVTATSITLSWSEPALTQVPEQVDFIESEFIIRVSRTNQTETEREWLVRDTNTYVITGLAPNTEYKVSLAMICGPGVSNKIQPSEVTHITSQDLSLTTTTRNCELPTNLNLNLLEGAASQLVIDTTLDPGRGNSYYCWYRPFQGTRPASSRLPLKLEELEDWLLQTSDTRNLTLANLLPGVTYEGILVRRCGQHWWTQNGHWFTWTNQLCSDIEEIDLAYTNTGGVLISLPEEVENEYGIIAQWWDEEDNKLLDQFTIPAQSLSYVWPESFLPNWWLPEQNYLLKVAQICSPQGDNNSWGPFKVFNFSTPACNPPQVTLLAERSGFHHLVWRIDIPDDTVEVDNQLPCPQGNCPSWEVKWRSVNNLTGNNGWLGPVVNQNSEWIIDGLNSNREYEFEWRTICCGGFLSNPITSFAQTLACEVIPVGLELVWVGRNEIEISWQPLNEILGYQIHYKKSEDRNWLTLAGLTTDANYRLSNLRGGISYDIAVSSRCLGDKSNRSLPLTVTTQSCPAPIDFSLISAGIDWVELNWANRSSEQVVITYHIVNNKEEKKQLLVLAAPVTIDKLQANQEYVFQLQGRCADGTVSEPLELNIVIEGCNFEHLALTKEWLPGGDLSSLRLSWDILDIETTLQVELHDGEQTIQRDSNQGEIVIENLKTNISYNLSYYWRCGDQISDKLTENITYNNCLSPSPVTLSRVDNQWLLSWAKVNTSLGYEVLARQENQDWETIINISDPELNQLILTEQQVNNQNSIGVRTRCSDNNSSNIISQNTSSYECLPPNQNEIIIHQIDNKVDLSWPSNEQVWGWQLNWRYQSENNNLSEWSQPLLVKEPMATVNNLLADNRYDIQIRSLCPVTTGGCELYSQPTTITISTSTNCPRPENVIWQTANRMVVWDSIPEAISYQVTIITVGQSQTSTETVMDNRWSANNLAVGDYEIQVRTICLMGEPSEASCRVSINIPTVITPPIDPPPEGGGVTPAILTSLAGEIAIKTYILNWTIDGGPAAGYVVVWYPNETYQSIVALTDNLNIELLLSDIINVCEIYVYPVMDLRNVSDLISPSLMLGQTRRLNDYAFPLRDGWMVHNPCPPELPVPVLSIAEQDLSQVVLEWTDLDEAVNYNLVWFNVANANDRGERIISTNRFSLTELTNGEVYQAEVTANFTLGQTISNQVEFSLEVLAAPVNLRVVEVTNPAERVHIRWDVTFITNLYQLEVLFTPAQGGVTNRVLLTANNNAYTLDYLGNSPAPEIPLEDTNFGIPIVNDLQTAITGEFVLRARSCNGDCDNNSSEWSRELVYRPQLYL